ncbi:MAG: hypothetical protein QXG05_04435 [Nitrososphaerota archaeon]
MKKRKHTAKKASGEREQSDLSKYEPRRRTEIQLPYLRRIFDAPSQKSPADRTKVCTVK